MNGPLVTAARKYLGVKFRHRGRTSYSLDCGGLVIRSYGDNGIALNDIKVYGTEPFRDGLLQCASASLGRPIRKAPVHMHDLKDGDVALIRFNRRPHHLVIIAEAIYAGVKTFNVIHADGQIGRVLEQRLNEEMASRITHLFRREI